MSVYLKVLPAVLLDPNVLLSLGQKICSIVRESLILDQKMEEVCTAVEREGRTLKKVISRNSTSPLIAELDDSVIACEKACFILKASIQLYLLHNDSEYRGAAQRLYYSIENPDKNIKQTGYDISSDRIRDIISNLESSKKDILLLNIQPHFNDLKESFEHFESIQLQNNISHKEEQMPTLRSSIALYGMLIDTLIANVRFENYQLLHRVESILNRIEEAVAEAMENNFKSYEIQNLIESAIA